MFPSSPRAARQVWEKYLSINVWMALKTERLGQFKETLFVPISNWHSPPCLKLVGDIIKSRNSKLKNALLERLK